MREASARLRRADADNDVDTCNGLWTAADVAAYLKCTRSTVYKLADKGGLPFVKVAGSLLRFQPELVRAYALGEHPPRPSQHLNLVPRGEG